MREPAHQIRSERRRLGLGSDALDAGWLALPFAGTPGGVGAVHVPPMDARQYVALRAELALQPAPREETRRRYHVPNEAALRALEDQWRQPARRAELEAALADFAVVLRGQVLR